MPVGVVLSVLREPPPRCFIHVTEPLKDVVILKAMEHDPLLREDERLFVMARSQVSQAPPSATGWVFPVLTVIPEQLEQLGVSKLRQVRQCRDRFDHMRQG